MTAYDSYCGLCCADCEFQKGNQCGGCIATGGKPFHGACIVADCCNEKGKGFCGDCAEFPCEKLKSYAFDPVHGDNGARIENCIKIKAALVAKAREGIDLIAPCGYHCRHCMYTQHCGGCRSSYNICSFASLCEGGVCRNAACAKERGLDGCYECKELLSCEQGFYAKKDNFVCKGTALYIQKHGKAAYQQAIGKAAGSLESANSYDEVVRLLESASQP